MNRGYNLKLDLQFRCNNSIMSFDEFDNNTSDFFIKITRQGKDIDISNTIPTLLVLKPSGVAVSQILKVENNCIYGNLDLALKDEIGNYIAKLMLIEGDKKTFISNIAYEVTENAILGMIDNDIVVDEKYSVLTEMIERLSTIELQEESRKQAEQNREQIFQNMQNEINDTLDKIADMDFGADLSTLVTKEELNKLNKELEVHTHKEYAIKEEVPTKVSELENDSNYITNIPSEYITETELENKGYLTEHQDLSNYAKKTELHNHDNKSVLDNITSNKIIEWNNKSTFDGNYNNLTNKPTIPSISGLASESYVNEYVENAIKDIPKEEVDLSNYAKKTELPTKLSQLANDKGYITSIPSEYVTESELNSKGYLTQHQDISGKADKSELHNHANKSVLDGITSSKVAEWNNKSTFDGDYNSLTNKPTIPTKTSQLTNDSNFITSIPNEYITETELEDKGYLTEHQDISGKLNKNLGAENAGKILVVGSDGNLILMDMPSGGITGDITGTVDENNNILLSGNLTDGTYVLKYENEDGTYSDVGTLVIGTVTRNLFNLETTKINTRFSGSSASEKAQNGVWLTDLIPLDISTHHTIYVKNAVMVRDVGTPPSPVVSFFNEGGSYLGNIQCNSSAGTGYLEFTELLGENYAKIKLDTKYTVDAEWWANVKYMRIAGVEDESGAAITKDDITDVIIKLNEPIE